MEGISNTARLCVSLGLGVPIAFIYHKGNSRVPPENAAIDPKSGQRIGKKVTV